MVRTTAISFYYQRPLVFRMGFSFNCALATLLQTGYPALDRLGLSVMLVNIAALGSLFTVLDMSLFVRCRHYVVDRYSSLQRCPSLDRFPSFLRFCLLHLFSLLLRFCLICRFSSLYRPPPYHRFSFLLRFCLLHWFPLLLHFSPSLRFIYFTDSLHFAGPVHSTILFYITVSLCSLTSLHFLVFISFNVPSCFLAPSTSPLLSSLSSPAPSTLLITSLFPSTALFVSTSQLLTIMFGFREPTPTQPICLILDFDETITDKDTMSILSEAVCNSHSSHPDKTACPAWQEICTKYIADLEKHHDAYENDVAPKEDRTCIRLELEWLHSLRAVERNSVRRAEERGFFRGFKDITILRIVSRKLKDGSLKVRPGLFELLKEVEARKGSITGIVSVNWHKPIIWAVWALHPELKRFAIPPTMANTIVPAEGLVWGPNNELTPGTHTGTWGCKNLLYTSQDKLLAMQCLIADQGLNFKKSYTRSPHTRVYIGDSATDLECLLAADIGIIMKKQSKSIFDDLNRLGIVCQHISEYRRYKPQWENSPEILYWAKDFHDVARSAIFRRIGDQDWESTELIHRKTLSEEIKDHCFVDLKGKGKAVDKPTWGDLGIGADFTGMQMIEKGKGEHLTKPEVKDITMSSFIDKSQADRAERLKGPNDDTEDDDATLSDRSSTSNISMPDVDTLNNAADIGVASSTTGSTGKAGPSGVSRDIFGMHVPTTDTETKADIDTRIDTDGHTGSEDKSPGAIFAKWNATRAATGYKLPGLEGCKDVTKNIAKGDKTPKTCKTTEEDEHALPPRQKRRKSSIKIFEDDSATEEAKETHSEDESVGLSA
jgi:hypothetical protein